MKNASPVVLRMFLVLAAVASCGRAEMLPSFRLDHAAWHATDIVVADEGDTVDGVLAVLEVWKGNLATGDTLAIAELAAFAPQESRSVKPHWLRPAQATSNAPPLVSGRRMILFLKRPAAAAGKSRQPNAIHWQPAGIDIQVSVVWVEQGRTYAFIQIVNPGPTVLIDTGVSEEDMRDKVARTRRVQEDLSRIAAIVDPARRARDAAAYVHTDILLAPEEGFRVLAREEAFRVLEGCKEAAVPVLRSLLAEESQAILRGRVIDAMAAAGGQDLGAEFTARLAEELKFWQKRAPSLKVGWLEKSGLELADSGLLRNRYTMLYHLLAGLERMRYEGCRETVSALRAYWRSMPQLEDKTGPGGISKACDAVLSALDRANAPADKADTIAN